MKQMSLGESEFLDEMNLVVPWSKLVSLIAPHVPAADAKDGRPSLAVETMVRIQLLKQWFNLSDPAMALALHDTPKFALSNLWMVGRKLLRKALR